jgi:NAD(P)H-dependent FMN reductase
MKLVLFNGSPRRGKSNSKLLLDRFLEGYCEVKKNGLKVYYLADKNSLAEKTEAFRSADIALLIFPLYTDSMPGIVKQFFETIHSQSPYPTKKLGFIVQSGFPEAIHSVFLEKYLEKLTARLGCQYLGTVIKGGVEGIQVMPPFMTRKVFTQFTDLGRYFAHHERFDEKIMARMKRPMRYSWLRLSFTKLLSKTGLTNYYWDSNLKKNNAYNKRFARPYAD